MEFWDGSGISWTICKQSAPRSRQITTPTHTHPFNGHFSGTTQVNRYQKGKTNLDFTEARDSEWQWHQLEHMQVCTSLQTYNHASTPPLSFYRRMPILPPNQQCQALKAFIHNNNAHNKVIETQARRIYRYHRAEGGVPRTTGCDHSTRPAAPNNTLPVASDICTTKTTGLLKHKGAQPCLSVKPSHFPLIRPLWGTTHTHTQTCLTSLFPGLPG